MSIFNEPPVCECGEAAIEHDEHWVCMNPACDYCGVPVEPVEEPENRLLVARLLERAGLGQEESVYA